ncbi:MAG TPA: aryldialkylphosphatase [Acidimicrobiia bacterium]|nr:aryldialkylphosphatase [Acidimicrobiia bacterium]
MSGPILGRPIPRGTVRTVLGDITPDQLGVTYVHEHLIIDSPIVAERFPHIYLPSVDEAVAEVETCREAGVVTMVDAMPYGGRYLDKLREVSRRTGMQIVAATGLHTEKYYPDDTPIEPGRFSADVAAGCGVFKAATGPDMMNPRALRLFAAMAETHSDTGVPIITHCEEGHGALIQIETLAGLGVPLSRVVISHTDKVPDPAYHRDILETGVNVEYDQALRQAGSTKTTPQLLAAMIDEGFLAQLMLGTDGARRSLWRTLGGSPGLAYLAAEFADVLESHGVTEESRRALFVDNPARWLAPATDEPPPLHRPR